ncbi:MAG: M14 family metallopeptidase [Candidatus Calescibacterium sp.]|nr:M14 family metallopeptidase [Candidatus Calescibacterium sp.]MDW8133177.1 M14 family metallopeptidase [Candidatus Calescibacterium sp.]
MDYFVKIGNNLSKVSSRNIEYAKEIDKDNNNILDYNEIKDFLIKNDDLKIVNTGQGKKIIYEKRIIREFSDFLTEKSIETQNFIRDYERIIESMKELQTKYPDRVFLQTIGKTFEGRDIVVIKVSKKNDRRQDKKSLLITGLHHAREWATGEAALNVVEKLLANYDTDENIKNLLDNIDIYVIPVVNPDGYEYSLKQSRWWRKNRKVFNDSVGVDLNRNYYTEKNPELYRTKGDRPDSIFDDYGASDRPYSDTYRGPYGASEEEIKAIQDFVNSNNINTVIDLHSYGNMILFPWGITDKPTIWENIYKEVGNEMNQVAGKKYWVSQAIYLYPTTGSSEDYHQEEGRFNYTIEVGKGFFPSSQKELNQIKEEVLNMTIVFMKNLMNGKIPVSKFLVSS